MEIVKVLPLDLRAELESNYLDETQPVTILSRDWYRPDYSPFFIDDFELFDGDGMLLKRNKHYTLESMNSELVKKTGRPVYHFFRILDTTLNYKKSYRIKYRSVGNTGFPRSLISKMVNDLINSDYWVDWDTQVLGKPPTFPAYQHWHDIETEVANWDQFTRFATQHLNYVMETKRAHYDRVMAMINKVEGLFSKEHRDYRARLKAHDQDYNNPHKLKREHFELDHIPNLPLSTISEDHQGNRNNRFTTPKGLMCAVNYQQRLSPNMVRSGEIKLNAFHELGGLSTLAPGRTFQTDQMTKASVVRDRDGGVNLYVGDATGQVSTSLYGKSGELTLTGKYNTLKNDVPKFDVVLRTAGQGVVLKQSTTQMGRYYPNPNDFLDPNNTDYCQLDFEDLEAQLGSGWEERSWFIPTPEGLMVTHRTTVNPGRPFTFEFRMFEMTYGVGPFPVLSPSYFTFDYDTITGVSLKDANKLSMVDMVEGTISGTYDRFHHTFTDPIKVFDLNGYGISLVSDIDVNGGNKVMIKLLTTATLDGKPYPIETAWEFDYTNRVFTRLLSGSNSRSVDNLSGDVVFGEPLVKLTRGSTQYPTLGLGHKGEVFNYFGGTKYNVGKIELDNLIEFYRTSIENRLNDSVTSKEVNVGLIVDPQPDSFNWMLVVPNDCSIIYRGRPMTLKRGMVDVRTNPMVSPGFAGTITVGVYSTPSGLRLTADANSHPLKNVFAIARVEIDSSGIVKVTKLTEV
ncbi:hypothetical protein [Photobacterium phage PDCC-1]|uniref:Uncharacterized protein n=1 Tax=Photobacterium phage PDCC-1 TaxID=2664246 RepID=A0A6B9J4E5_9CAUD|nr:minor tail protein [Photobacterium phage PDCC-1]QGZ14452.1 hypothetical protein [Photobacterium phage PDCC-1]